MKYSGIAFEMLAFIFIGVWAGYKLDQYFELEFPVFLLVFSVVSCIGSIFNVIRRLPKDD
ncbi:AtpZ/AtpI family protein [Reichenbachiella sp. MALMAid0571]|uniref:AtpZ/AtpI family protein n=1 Tax=Reichenbachiella sp. MALMAid0571 TaxID=3143939 RepID=UPI0032DF9DDA